MLLVFFGHLVAAQPAIYPSTPVRFGAPSLQGGATVPSFVPSYPTAFPPNPLPATVYPSVAFSAPSAFAVTTTTPPPLTVTKTATVAKAPAPAKDPKKEAADAAKKAHDELRAWQGVQDAVIVNHARDWDKWGAQNLRNGILNNPLVTDINPLDGFQGENGRVIKAGSFLSRVVSRRKVARTFQRQLDRYKEDHPTNITRTDRLTVDQFRQKRNENDGLGDAAKTSAYTALITNNAPLTNGLTAVNLFQTKDGQQAGAAAASRAFDLARDKFLKNTSDTAARQTFNQADDFRYAKKQEASGTRLDAVNGLLPLAGGSKNAVIAGLAVGRQINGNHWEKNVARQQLDIARQKMTDDPSEDNFLKLKLARAQFDFRDQAEQSIRSRGLGTVLSGFSTTAKAIFGASQILRFKDAQDAQKRVARIALQIKRRDFAKKFGNVDATASSVPQRLLALSTYGRPAARPVYDATQQRMMALSTYGRPAAFSPGYY